MEQNRKKVIGNALLFAAVFALTVYAVFHGEDLPAMMEAIRDCDERWLIPAAGCVAVFIGGEAAILRLLLNSCGRRLRPGRCFLISSVGFFFSAVTPSAGGGQPAQVYFMRRERVPVAVSAVTLMAVTITYKLVLIVTGAGLALFGQDMLRVHMEGALWLFWLGLGLAAAWIGLLLMLTFHPHMARKLLLWGLGLLERLHLLRSRPARREKLLSSMEKYAETASYFRTHLGLMALVLAITFLQRFALFTVPWLVCRAFGIEGTGWFSMAVLQSAIAVSADMLPLPGGMGVSEGLFLRIFEPVFGEALVLPAMVLSRGVEFYCRLLFTAALSLVAFAVLGRPHKKRETEGTP